MPSCRGAPRSMARSATRRPASGSARSSAGAESGSHPAAKEDVVARTFVLPIWLALACAAAAPAPGAAGADAGAIVAAERGFAAQVRAEGVREGFLAWLAPTGVVFRPGPVNGLAAYAKQPGGWHGLLAWSPVHAAISADGKLGWSTGPWTWQRDTTQRKPDAHGEYLTVWRKRGDGAW